MARPIKETPILYGEDARKFRKRMQERHTESLEERRRRLQNYEEVCEWVERGKASLLSTRVIP